RPTRCPSTCTAARRSRCSIYLEVLDERMQALKQALQDGFGVSPARVVQSSYEPIHHDETGALCGTQPALGMDVHPGLRLSRQRLQETADFLQELLGRLECIAGRRAAPGGGAAPPPPPASPPAPAPAFVW